jgi:primase-polymerase (primpol)-like protein
LANHLAFWTGRDLPRMQRLFQESGLYRAEKWDTRHYADGRSYGEVTLAKACANAREVYTPRCDSPRGGRRGHRSRNVGGGVTHIRVEVG